jgi:rhamnogalacturonyl hydrolase YesR
MKCERQFFLYVLTAVFAVLLSCCDRSQNMSLKNFPAEADPINVGNKLTERFLEQGHSKYGNPLRANEPIRQISYPDVCVWLGGLWFSEVTGNQELIDRLIRRFQPLFTTEQYLQPQPDHVDNNVFGAIPLELYLITHEEKYRELGMKYANTQWEVPEDATSEEKAWADNDYSWQTRLMIDDMFMITAIQSQAYRVTGDIKYIERAAREMIVYLDTIQLPGGLFYHGPSAPFCWARGNGWMAVGMTEILRILPEDNVYRPVIMQGYLKMMNALKTYRKENGMWRQLVDDEELWEETSGSAMFTYAIIMGVKNKWLPPDVFGPIARKAWLALCSRIEDNGDIQAVCEGTGTDEHRQHYIDRRPITGDWHGQAPMLWCAYALTDHNR